MRDEETREYLERGAGEGEEESLGRSKTKRRGRGERGEDKGAPAAF